MCEALHCRAVRENDFLSGDLRSNASDASGAQDTDGSGRHGGGFADAV